MQKVIKYPYMISFPDIDESQWTTWLIKSKDDEDELLSQENDKDSLQLLDLHAKFDILYNELNNLQILKD